MSQATYDYFSQTPHEGPLLVVDLANIKQKYNDFRALLPMADVFYAIKANAERPIINMLSKDGSSFDAASINEIRMALAAGTAPDKISYGNTIKKEADIATAYALGVRIFAYDSLPELEKIARVAPDAKVYCRILFDCEGAAWPLSRKFGCTPEMATDLLAAAHKMGVTAYGVSFHVGSQQQNPAAWDKAITIAAGIFNTLKAGGVELGMLNMGGGFPASYSPDARTLHDIAPHIIASLNKNFPEKMPRIIIEPGRGMVAEAGIIRTEVVLISHKSNTDKTRWVYLDIGLFNGMTETMGEILRFPIITPHDGDNTTQAPAILAGPTCDSVDIMYERTPMTLPTDLKIGDHIFLTHTGAYTTSYSTSGFNGFDPLKAHCILA